MPDPEGKLVTPVAFDASGDPRSLTVDADDNLNVNLDDQTGDIDVNIAAQDADIEIVQRTSADLRAGIEGWIDGGWQKNPLILGYSGRGKIVVGAQSVGAGETTGLSDAVPAGEIWVVQHLLGFHNDGVAARQFALYARQAAANIEVYISPALAANTSVVAPNTFILAEGDQLKVSGWVITVGNWVLARGLYTRVDIDR